MAQDPTFLPARISLRNLALTLIDERAPALPGRPPWMEIARREEVALKQASAAQVHALLDPRRAFPNFALWHVFERVAYYPGIGSELAANPLGQRAAAWLLQEANRGLRDGDFEQARALAAVAPQFDPGIQPVADSLTAAAAAKQEETRLLGRAQNIVRRLGTFLRSLSGLTLDDLDRAREAQALAAPFIEDQTLDRLYRERIENLVLEELDATSSAEDRRSRLWTIAHQYALSESVQAYGKAAGHCLVQPVFSSFWKAIVDGDLDAARVAFNQAASLIDCTDLVRKEEAVLRLLEEAKTRSRRVRKTGPRVRRHSPTGSPRMGTPRDKRVDHEEMQSAR